MSFGKRLRQLRTEKGLRQEDLAEMIRVHRATVGKYETDERFPDRETLEAIADFFDVSVDYLLNRTNVRNAYSDGISNDNQKIECPYESIEEEMFSIGELLNFIREKRKGTGKG